MQTPGRTYLQLKLRDLNSRAGVRLIEVSFRHRDGIDLPRAHLGEVALYYDAARYTEAEIVRMFTELGFEPLQDPEDEIVERIRMAAIELMHGAGSGNVPIRKSDYIAEKLSISYDRLSRIYSRKKGKTLETFLIQLKIEKAKELLASGKYTLSEISYLLDYSSVQYLSNQFKKVTGMTVSRFRQNPAAHRMAIEDL